MPFLPGEELVERQRMFEAVDAWLTDTDSDLCLVTGPPGAGKSVFARQLVARLGAPPNAGSSPLASKLCLAHYCDANDEQSLDPKEFIEALSRALVQAVPGFAAAVVASIADDGLSIHNETTFQIDQMQPGAQAVGLRIDNLRIDNRSELGTRRALNRLVLSPLAKTVEDSDETIGAGPLVVIIDDLSAAFAHDDKNNISAVLRLLLRQTNRRRPTLRFVVTSRADPWALRGLPQPRIALAHNNELTSEDLTRYVSLRLSRVAAARRQAWTDRVVEVSSGNFLVAKHVLDDLLHDSARLDADPSLAHFPSSLDDLYEGWVSEHLQADRTQWRRCYVPVLGAIAVAQGPGFNPDRIAAVTGLSGTEVQEALEDCAPYLHTDDLGEVRYYHDSFREFLIHRKIISRDWHRSVVLHLAEIGARDWNTVDNYIREHLAYHAGHADLLHNLVADPGFLINADPRAIERAVSQAQNRTEFRAAAHPLLATYLRNVALLIGRPVGERAARLELAARGRELAEAADAFAGLDMTRPWQAFWGYAVPSYEHEIIGRHPEGIDAMATLTVDGRPAIASGGQGGTLRIWDVKLREPILPDIAVDPFGVIAVSACRLDEGWAVLAAGPFHATILSGQGLKDRVDYSFRLASTTSALLLSLGDDALTVFGFSDGSVEIRGVRSEAAAQAQPHEGPVFVLAADPKSAAGAFVSGDAAGQAFRWSVTPSAIKWQPLSEEEAPGWVSASAVKETDEGTYYAIGDSAGRIQIIRAGEDLESVEVGAHPPASETGTAVRATPDRLFGRTVWSRSPHGATYRGVLDLLEEIDHTHQRSLSERHDASGSKHAGNGSWQNAMDDEGLSGDETLYAPNRTVETVTELRTDGSAFLRAYWWSPYGDSCEDFLHLSDLPDRRHLTVQDFAWYPVAVRGGVTAIDVHDDPPLLASGGQTGEIGIMSLRDLKVSLLPHRGGAVGAVVISAGPDGLALLAAESNYGNITSWLLDPAGRPEPIPGSLASRITNLVLLAEGRYAALLSESGDVVVVDIRQGEEVTSLPHPAGPGNALLLGVGPFAVRVMDGQGSPGVTLSWTDPLGLLPRPEVHVPELDLVQSAVALHAELPTILILGMKHDDEYARAVTGEFRNGSWHWERAVALGGTLRAPRAFALPDADRRTWLIISDGGNLALSLITGHVWHPNLPHLGGEEVDGVHVFAIDFLHQGQPAFLIPGRGELMIFEARDALSRDAMYQAPRFRRVLIDAPLTITALAASADGRLLLAGGADGTLRWWHDTDERTGEIDLGSPVRAVVTTGENVIVATDDHLLALRLSHTESWRTSDR